MLENIDMEPIILHNFLIKEECQRLIQYYNHNLDKTFVYNMTKPIKVLNSDDLFVKNCLQKITDKCKTLAQVYMDNAEIIHWLNNGYMLPHYDEGDKFAAIVYLNDEYQGGELVLADKKIKPNAGELIIFENGALLHSVNTVIGERYTLSTWFKEQN
jgi:predicted 2-oxoglutarate/Fe(II)-dependent dioxygenase YbiX